MTLYLHRLDTEELLRHALNSATSDLERELARRLSDCTDAVSKVEDLNDQVAELQAANDDLRGQMASLRDEMDETAAKSREIDRANDALLTENTNLEAEIIDLRSRLNREDATMLEAKIEQLNASIQDLIKVLQAQPVAPVQVPVAALPPVAPVTPEVAQPVIAPAKVEAPKATAPAPTPITELDTAPAIAQAAAAAAPGVTLPDVQKALLTLARTKGKDPVIDALSRFGVTNAKDLKADHYAAVIQLAQQALEA